MAGQAEHHSKNLDVLCLRCGAMNIADNKVCGRCGASLPLIYDQEGRIMSLRERAFGREILIRRVPNRVSTVRWFLRFGLILFALYIAYMIFRHHR